jgi:mannose-6-phosphate isomerase-like protein (cupin superfamily)
MFERYTERTRRIIFFARYEAGEFGSRTIEAGHLLLGLIAEAPFLVDRLCGHGVVRWQVASEINAQLTRGEKIPTIDLPLSDECKRIFAYAAEEAELSSQWKVRPEHFVLAMLREENFMTAQVMARHGLTLEQVRKQLAEQDFSDAKLVPLSEVVAHLSIPESPGFIELFRRGSLSVKGYAPRGTDAQAPHMRDEAYIVISGSGEFIAGDQRFRFSPGDFLFAAVGVDHRFENFTDDLLVWVIFYGDLGGECS